MNTLLIVIVVAFLGLAVAAQVLKKAAASASTGKGKTTERPRRRQLLTERERAMHHRLVHALPDFVILAQVSFGALLTARAQAARNTFDRKTADFVVCDKAFQVLAVIELDDASHKDKAAKDSARDTLLTDAGYRVLRYSNVPDLDRVRLDFAPHESAAPVTAQPPALKQAPTA